MSFVSRLALLYAGIFGAIGVQLPFLPVWLAAKGLDAGEIGGVLAAATAVRVLTVPFATRAADRFASLKGALMVSTLAVGLSLTALANASGPVAILICYSLAAAAGGATLPLAETYGLHGLAARGRAYGPARLWGSAAFIAGTMATGLLLAVLAPVHLIWLLVGTYWLAAAAATSLLPVDTGTPAARREARTGLLLKDMRLMAVIAASGLIQGSHALLYGFGTLQWAAAGLSGFTIGVLWSIGVLAEIVLFAASARFPPALGPAVLLLVGAGGAMLRWLGMAFDPAVTPLAGLQVLHALSFGATHLGAVQLVARAAPSGLAATAQGLLATANGTMMAAAMAASGMLHSRWGAGAYLAMALVAAGGGVLALMARRAEPA